MGPIRLRDFAWAIRRLKEGNRVARHGWNGKGMFLFLVPGSTFKVNRPPLLGIYPEGTEINYLPHIDMKTADGGVVPWVASQSDLLCVDWTLIDEANEAEIGEAIETGEHDIDRDGPPAFSS